MPKFKVGDVVDYEDINESGARFWSTNWKIGAVATDGYWLWHTVPPEGKVFQPFWAESKMRLSEPKYGRMAAEILKQETASIEEPREIDEKARLIQQMMTLLHASPDVINFISAAFYSTYTTVDSADLRRVWIQDIAAALNRRRVLPNENVDRFQELGYEYMEASD